MYRIGNVSAVDAKNRLVRVNFPDVGIVSGWLKVVSAPPLITLDIKTGGSEWEVNEKYASADRKLGIGEEYTKKSPDEIEGKLDPMQHEVKVKVHAWLPFIGQPVLCLYNDDFNSDGFVIGGL